MSTAWIWHIIGMVFMPWVYPFVALTVWQQRSGQTFMRRVLWAVVLTVSAVCLVGLPAFVVFSRRWYWIHRTNANPAACGVGARPPDSSKGYFEWVAVTGAALADSILHRPSAPSADNSRHLPYVPPAPPRPPLPEPWGGLVAEMAASEARLRNAYAKATGPAAASIERAHAEAMAAQQAVTSIVYKAMEVDQTRNAIDQTRLENRLAELRARPDANQDLKAAKQSIEAQLASRMRMGEIVARLESQLHRMAAQLGEAAAQAEELSLYPPGTVIGNDDMTIAVDGLTAMREALEAVQLPTTPS